MTESFEDARIFAQVIMSDCDAPIISRLQKAHDHEMEQLRRSRFREGYEAGQRSMDAEHYAVALRLKHLPLDEDSHGNLSQIARAIWHGDFGWTRGACVVLRDELVRLLGGVHDEPAQVPASDGACDTGCDCGNQQPQTVTYDELGNERHEAVCELRKLPDWYTHDGKQSPDGKFNEALSDAIGVMGLPSFAKIRDRLIHLLGGDEPNFTEIAETIKFGGECDGKIMENGENHQIEASNTVESSKYRENYKSGYITDELREWASDRHCKGISHTDVLNIGLIADRIDEQFNHAMTSRSAELGCYKLRINQLEQERDELKEKYEAKANMLRGLMKAYNRMQRELYAKIDLNDHDAYELAAAFTGCDECGEYKQGMYREFEERIAIERERDELQKKLDEYERHDTVEDIVRDIHLGKVTDTQAIERIRALNG